MKRLVNFKSGRLARSRTWLSGQVNQLKNMKLKQQIIRGTVYFRGAPSHFDPVVRRVLQWRPEAGKLNYSVTIDVIRSILNREPTYRIDYTLVRLVAVALTSRSKASKQERSGWFFWLRYLLKWPATGA